MQLIRPKRCNVIAVRPRRACRKAGLQLATPQHAHVFAAHQARAEGGDMSAYLQAVRLSQLAPGYFLTGREGFLDDSLVRFDGFFATQIEFR